MGKDNIPPQPSISDQVKAKEGLEPHKERFQLRDRPGPAGVMLSSFATREEADKALTEQQNKNVPGESPVLVDMGAVHAAGQVDEMKEASKTKEQKEAEKPRKPLSEGGDDVPPKIGQQVQSVEPTTAAAAEPGGLPGVSR